MTPEERVAAAKARVLAAIAKRTAAEAARATDAEAEAAEREASDAEAIASAVESIGDVGVRIACVETDMGVIIVKRPNGAAFRKFQDAGKSDTQSYEKLVRPCIVSPDAARVDRIFDELPATLVRVANAVCVLAGVRESEVAGK